MYIHIIYNLEESAVTDTGNIASLLVNIMNTQNLLD
jgi:hypothetical protein